MIVRVTQSAVALGLALVVGASPLMAQQSATIATAPSSGEVPSEQPSDRPPVRTLTTDEAFKLGLLLMDADRPRDAAAVFSAILASDPDLERVRLELARAYFLSKQWGRSRSEFLSVLSGDIPQAVRFNIQRFLRQIDARRGFDWDADVGVAMLGNTRNYRSDTTYINFGGQRLPFRLSGRDGKTAPGLRYNFSAGLSEPIAPLSGKQVTTVAFGRITALGDEGPGTRYDDLTLRGELGARLIFARSSLTLAPSFSRRFLATSEWEDRWGGRATFSTRGWKGTTFTVTGSWHRINNLRQDSRDGHIARTILSAQRPFTPRMSLGASLLIEDREAQSPVDDYRRLRLTGFGVFDVGRGITLTPSVYVEQKNIERPNPGAADETGMGASLLVESSRIILGNGFTPYARFEVSGANSDLEAFSYLDYGVSVGLERRF